LAALLLPLVLGGCFTKNPPLPLAKNVDLPRMYGGWYIVATIPNRIEKGIVAPCDVYSPRSDGAIREDFYFQRGGFHGARHHLTTHDEVDPNSGGAAWHVQLIWPIKLPFLLLYVDKDYRFALFGERSRDLGWIYARDPRLSDHDYLMLKAKFAAAGYDSSKFKKFVQLPGQIGKQGFWNDGILP
jgi:apolipoprotein D and lipocalin family protein